MGSAGSAGGGAAPEDKGRALVGAGEHEPLSLAQHQART